MFQHLCNCLMRFDFDCHMLLTGVACSFLDPCSCHQLSLIYLSWVLDNFHKAFARANGLSPQRRTWCRFLLFCSVWTVVASGQLVLSYLSVLMGQFAVRCYSHELWVIASYCIHARFVVVLGSGSRRHQIDPGSKPHPWHANHCAQQRSRGGACYGEQLNFMTPQFFNSVLFFDAADFWHSDVNSADTSRMQASNKEAAQEAAPTSVQQSRNYAMDQSLSQRCKLQAVQKLGSLANLVTFEQNSPHRSGQAREGSQKNGSFQQGDHDSHSQS